MSATENDVICCDPAKEVDKLKILAIHGYRQNADTFKQKTGSFRKMVHKWAQFFYITAPHKVIVVEDLNKIGEVDESADSGTNSIFTKNIVFI